MLLKESLFLMSKTFILCRYFAILFVVYMLRDKSQARVLREVKALAKLDHKNIIRYFSCWKEQPPLGWEEEHDKNWIE